ncbi:MAG: glycosyltransferase family 4 protein [Planctomycetes bacterium]|nr:glycosyltransferase family 4 protein [Planctomycetota bacterium]
MRIALVIYNYSDSKGGVERYVADLTKHLLADGHEVHIFCHRLLDKPPEGQPAPVFHIIDADSVYPPLRYSHFARNVARELAGQKYDIIQGFGRTYSQDIYRVGSGCHWEYLKHRHPSMSHIFGQALQWLNPRNRIVMHLEKRSFAPGAYKKVICISKMVKREIQHYYNVADEAIEVIYNGVDLDRFNPDNRGKYRLSVRERFNLKEEDIVILFTGSGFERKGLRYAIETFSLLTKNLPLKLLVVGNGNIAKYTGFARRLGVAEQVVFAGPQDRIEQYYAASDIFLFPTLYEPFGTVCLEAMASGLPVVTSRSCGASEIMTDSLDSFVVDDPRDVRALAQKVGFLLTPSFKTIAALPSEVPTGTKDGWDRTLCENIGKLARLTASRYSFDENYKQVLQVYKEICPTLSA